MKAAAVQFASPEQTGFVPKRFISDSTHFLKLFQDQIEKENTEGMFLFLDMEKAFDRVSWEFLLEGLRSLGFGEEFIALVQI